MLLSDCRWQGLEKQPTCGGRWGMVRGIEGDERGKARRSLNVKGAVRIVFPSLVGEERSGLSTPVCCIISGCRSVADCQGRNEDG
jgi:hypothetical protein